MVMVRALQLAIQPAILAPMVSDQGIIDPDFSGGAFSKAFSTAFAISTPLGKQFSSAFSQDFTSFNFVKQFSTAFSDAFATQ